MLKKTVTYKDFDGKDQTEDLFFHMTKAELVEFVAQYPDDLQAYVAKVSNDNNKSALIAMFRDLILRSYGVKDNGKFRKSTQLSEDFSHSEAYSTLFFDLFSQTQNMIDFFNAVLGVDIEKLQGQLPQ